MVSGDPDFGQATKDSPPLLPFWWLCFNQFPSLHLDVPLNPLNHKAR